MKNIYSPIILVPAWWSSAVAVLLMMILLWCSLVITVSAQVDIDIIIVVLLFLGLGILAVGSVWLGLDRLFGLDSGAVDNWWCGGGLGLDWLRLCVVFVARWS